MSSQWACSFPVWFTTRPHFSPRTAKVLEWISLRACGDALHHASSIHSATERKIQAPNVMRTTSSVWSEAREFAVPVRPASYFFFFGPGLRVPFSSRAFSIWAKLQSLTALPFRSLTRGAMIVRVAIQCCKVARGIFVILATWTVV